MLSETTREKLSAWLKELYGDRSAETLAHLESMCERYSDPNLFSPRPRWSERDVVLITYGDQVQSRDRSALETLTGFLTRHGLDDLLTNVHLLPFCPYTSDDGFSVVDYRQIDPVLGTWEDVKQLGRHVQLMFDLVLNHCSQKHAWFQQFLDNEAPGREYFVVVDSTADLSQVVRPRSLPLLTRFNTANGPRDVWTTFSDDQVDLNYGNPNLLIEMLDVLLFYAAQGARIVRLDAIAYLWKIIGTSCIHLRQTHVVVKIMRALLDELAPGTVVLTETNVPHRENVSYFGDGDEAQMVYQFSLAPLLLDACLTGDAGPLQSWLRDLEPCRPGTTYLNFTASHDGVGMRPLEGLVDSGRIEQLVAAVRERGGQVSTRRNADGSDTPYELNITYFSAVAGAEPDCERQARMFLASQSVMLALQGIPAVYFHSLVGTPNDDKGVLATGRARSINRRKFTEAELEAVLNDPGLAASHVFKGYQELLRIRQAQPAFHPDANQRVIESPQSSVLIFERGASPDGHAVRVIANFGTTAFRLRSEDLPDSGTGVDLISGRSIGCGDELPPRAVFWIK